MSKQLIVFLDFDGVLHHFFPEKGLSDEENAHFAFSKNLEKAIKELKDIDIKIVISSSWRENYSIEQIKSNFSDYMASKIIGFTPVIENSQYYKDLVGAGSDVPSHTREIEAMMWLDSHPEYKNWVAIDDVKDIWKTYYNVLICEKGFQKNLINKFKSLCIKITTRS